MKTKDSKSKKNLEKKLKSYATIAASVIAADASSQVIYTDIRDTTLVNSGDFFDIDFNNDGTTDVTISLNKSSSSYSGSAFRYASIRAVGQSSAEINTQLNSYSFYEAAAFNSNSGISGSVNSFYSYGYVGWVSSYTTSSGSGSFRSGQFPGAGQKFMGAKFNIGNNVHYGWVRLDVPTANDQFTVFDFAYDTTAGAPILAGDTGIATGINELDPQQLELYAADAVLHFPNSLEKNADYRVYNLKGQLQERGRIAAGKSEQRLRQSYKGIYIVELSNAEGTFRKKLWLESK